MLITQFILDNAKSLPSQVAIYDEQGALTYSQLATEVTAMHQTLIDAGIQKGMGVGVCGKNSREFVIMMLAVMHAEAVVMPISNQLKGAEIRNIIKTSGLHALLVDTGSNLDLAEEEIGNPLAGNWKFSWHKAYDGKAFAGHIENAALIRFTSGTTGKSKGVILSHNSIAERLSGANALLQLGPDDVVVWVLSMAYHFVVSILLYLRYGCSIAICPKFLAPTILEYANRYKGTFLYASPMHIKLLANDKSEQQLTTVKRVISTSTAISRVLCERFEQRFGLPVSQAYGIIEVGLPIVNYGKSREHPDAVGYALPDCEVEILDDDFNILPAGEIGHLAMSGPGMFDGYLEPPTTREDNLRQGWFMTGDLASKMDDGLVKLEGRKKSMINVSGNKVFPEEVEAVLEQHPAVAQSKVSGFQHRLMGELVQAEVVLKPGQEVAAEALIKFCRERLITYKVPQRVAFVEELAMTGSGKILRK